MVYMRAVSRQGKDECLRELYNRVTGMTRCNFPDGVESGNFNLSGHVTAGGMV